MLYSKRDIESRYFNVEELGIRPRVFILRMYLMTSSASLPSSEVLLWLTLE